MRFSATALASYFGVHLLLVGGALVSPSRAATPEPLPDPRVPGFQFPTSEATLTATVTAMSHGDTAAAATIYQHAWGLWTALTSFSKQMYERQPLRVFETWSSVDDLLGEAAPKAATTRSHRTVPLPRRIGILRFASLPETDAPAAEAEPVIGAVKFDPTAADHIVQQQLLHVSALQALLDGGAIQVPPFPATALVAKPVYRIARTSDLVGGRYFLLKIWSGPPTSPQAWGPEQWTAGVWVDLRDGGAGNGAVDVAPVADGSSRSEATTYPVSAFVHHRLSAADAAAFNASQASANASAGDTALLVAMHVAGREIARWTWQTYWWTPDPAQPPLPSTTDIASARPAQLQGAPRHYAMTLAYSMLAVSQPYTGGANTAPAIYAYNPWIEAHFGPADLPDSIAGFAPDGTAAANNTGVQTNCMSCHAQATYHPATATHVPQFTGARYVDLGDPEFVGTLQTEFLWSLARHAQ